MLVLIIIKGNHFTIVCVCVWEGGGGVGGGGGGAVGGDVISGLVLVMSRETRSSHSSIKKTNDNNKHSKQ